ncbi:hypothetical protein X777_08538 [Ooceraea biroi]|uniref:Uncharacterized protein n=1 Tax=Ooceraea biroi TaxID=2015173 RepID=A0A026W988_OOCBI|nr:hypothetical protein X777_08538 [Ooceraea biroi]
MPLGSQDVSSQPDKEEFLDLDEETLKILGDEPLKSQEELKIHIGLANRWNPWLQQGLKKEIRNELLRKYPRVDFCSLEPPILNQELSTLNPNILKKDRYFTFTQNLAGSALLALAPVITDLVSRKTAGSRKMLENLWDAAQLLAEIQHSQTIARKAYILPSVSKQIAEQWVKRKVDKYLFGENLGDRIKEIKMINKLGQEIKLQPAKTIPRSNQEIILPEIEPLSRSLRSRSTSRSSLRSREIPISLESGTNQVSILAGRLTNFINTWKLITSDPFVLQCVRDYKIPFISLPCRSQIPPMREWAQYEYLELLSETNRLLTIGAIVHCEATEGQFLSSYFVAKKPDGSNRLCRKEGRIAIGKEEVLGSWRNYFEHLLNPDRSQDDKHSTSAGTDGERDDLKGPPTLEEIRKAIRKLRKIKLRDRQHPRGAHKIRWGSAIYKTTATFQRNMENGKNPGRLASEHYPPDT